MHQCSHKISLLLLDLPDGRCGAHYVWVKNLLWLVMNGHEHTHMHAHKL